MANTTLIKKLNIVAPLLLFAVSMIGINNANAGIREWVTNSDKNLSINQSFGFLSSFMNIADSLDNRNRLNDAGDLPIVQNNTLVSVDSPNSIQTIKATQNTISKAREMVVAATAYSSTPDQTDDSPFITAWNTHVRDGIVAANFLPFGTKIKIPEIYGDKIFVVEDRMNRRYWYKVDIWFPDRQSALEFGLRTIRIQILES